MDLEKVLLVYLTKFDSIQAYRDSKKAKSKTKRKFHDGNLTVSTENQIVYFTSIEGIEKYNHTTFDVIIPVGHDREFPEMLRG